MIQVGTSAVDTTPKPGTHLSGSGMGDHRPARQVLDPLYAKAIVFKSGDSKLCLLTLDICIITEDFTARVREAAKHVGIDHVMVHSLQIHSAPSTGICMLDPDYPFAVTPETEYLLGSEKAYVDYLLSRAVQAIEQANADLEPAQIAHGRSRRDDLAFNRREEGTIDPEVGVCAFRAADGRLKAVLLHYSCHPVNVFLNGVLSAPRKHYFAVSADWPGVWSAETQREFGGHAIVVNGCSGNINPGPYRRETVWDHVKQGRELARTAREIIPGLRYGEAAGISVATRRVVLPYREVPAERLAEVERILGGTLAPRFAADGNADGEWFLAASTKSVELLRRRSPQFEYEIQVFRIGEVAIVSMPGEPFSEGQLAVKAASPAQLTIVAHMTTQYVGYLPTRDAYTRFGHEANRDCTYWAKFAPGSLEIAVDTVNKMTRGLWKQNQRGPE